MQGALEALAARSSIGHTAVRFGSRLDASITLDLEARNHLFRIAQEAVQNALKHAGAGTVEIDLWVHARGVRLTIQDDGVGLPRAGSLGSGLGMRTMQFSRQLDRRPAADREPQRRGRVHQLRSRAAQAAAAGAWNPEHGNRGSPTVSRPAKM